MVKINSLGYPNNKSMRLHFCSKKGFLIFHIANKKVFMMSNKIIIFLSIYLLFLRKNIISKKRTK